jgi:hypothetical protein
MSLQAQSRRTSSEWHLPLSSQQRQGRALNAVASLLRNTLRVPNIYLKPKFNPRELPFADVLAIDRAGSGDVHGVHIQLAPAPMAPTLRKENLRQVSLPLIMNSDFHFKYIAVEAAFVDFLSKQNLFAEDGIGRIGIIEIIESPNALPEARIAVPAERFRVASDMIKKFDNFQKKTPADMEIRG